MVKVNQMVSGIESINKNQLYVRFSYKNLVGHQMNLTDGSYRTNTKKGFSCFRIPSAIH